MGLINSAKSVLNTVVADASQVPAGPVNVPLPTPQNVPSVNDVVTNGQTIANTVVTSTTDLVNSVLNAKIPVNTELVNLANQVAGDFANNIRSILGNLDQDTQGKLDVRLKFSLEPEKLLTALGSAMSAAEDALAKRKGSDLFISDGKVVTEFYVKLPGPASGTSAFAHVELNLKSKQYLALTAGKG